MPGPDKKMPCKGCEDRNEACHGRCEAYRKYAEEMRKKRIFVTRENSQRSFPPTVRYSKASGRYVAPKGIMHKKEGRA